MNGHKISHSNRKSNRLTYPNLQSRRFWVASENRYVQLRLSTSAIRTIDKVGIDAVLRELRASGSAI